MRYRSFVILFFSLWAISLSAEQLTPAQALQRLGKSNAKRAKAQNAQNAQTPTYTSTINIDDKSYNTVYVFNNTQGFTMVAADDMVPALIAYSETGNFCNDTIPPSVKEWLNYYNAEIGYAIKTGKPIYSSANNASTRRAIQPLLRTKWGQSDPFNRMTPMMTDGTHAVTGCVATALAQILYYYKNPAQPMGMGSWTCSDGVEKTGTYNMLDYKPDYSAIAENYGYTYDENWNATYHLYTKNQSKAIAELMYAAGASVQMQYGHSSGAYSELLPYALIDNWGFDKSAKYNARDSYTDDEWETLLYGELEQKRPVLYGGLGVMGGHQFICDGYDGEGLYHFDWGWNGQDNGYYTIMGTEALDPYGYGGWGFYFRQDIITGVRLNQDVIPTLSIKLEDSSYDIRKDGETVSQVELGEQLAFGFEEYGLRNYTGRDVSILAGARFLNVSTGQSIYKKSAETELEHNGYINELSINTSGIGNGRYKIYPAVCWKNVKGARWSTVTIPANVEIPEVVIGIEPKVPEYDINGDDLIDSDDINDLKNYLLNKPTSEGFSKEKADLNNDKSINIVDLQMLQNYVTNLQNN